ncbi:WGR domain-containing protein [Pseudomonas sp. Au-Pse12]|uniref:WGR domain-containing protein n=1 Tax=Pseudomonas sp. Au-Pse12 TaxID=2906459 RepID=UPI001E2D4238|nr:WGR domain-containing protein [Pseudomonas sp. Au-Pse12]MCE4052889.1 WGR domain-containing protein [Pseudomonas sp. Au-Pse12]
MDPITQPLNFAQLLQSHDGAAVPIDDVLFLALPLLRQVAQLHELGHVAQLSYLDVVLGPERTLQLRHPEGQSPRLALEAIKQVQPNPESALNIVGKVRLTRDSETGVAITDLQVQEDPHQAIDHPVFLTDLHSWEHRLGHHDEISDIFQLGQLLACLACGLDFADINDLKSFAAHRRNLFQLNGRLNPVLANVIVEMTELNRHERATDVGSLARRLESWREQPASLDVERVLAQAEGPASRRTVVLEHLRNRLFDLSRRNRLLYFRPTQASVNLTVASVPLVMRIESIRPEALCTWQPSFGGFSEQVLSGKPVGLQQWLRFEDQTWLQASLERLIQETRRDRAEFGFSNLRLVVAFMHWHNLKDTPEERIVTPLLWLPVELSRKKGVRDQFMLQCDETEAEFNPVLRHQLRQLYDIQLPETVDLQNTSVEHIHAEIARQIKLTEPGVELRLQSKPQIELIHQKAVQHLHHFQRRRARQRSVMPLVKPDFSYDREEYRPLGLQLFQQRVLPSELPLRLAIGAKPSLRTQHPQMVASSNENSTFAMPENQGHRYAWDIDLTQVTLANFNYRKMSLVRDYAQLIDEPAQNQAFDRMFSIEPRDVDVQAPDPIPLPEQWNVVAGDATQNAAVSLARTGRNFIIQGPPGTGKSQTITNLIADYAGRGLRVLFVCEKRAALDVVFHRLQQSELGELCCLIHDSQTDKKAFVGNLRECYERWIAGDDQTPQLQARRDAALATLSQQLGLIERFEQAMAGVPEPLACSVRELVRQLIELPAAAQLPPEALERLPEWRHWQAQSELTGRLYQAVHERFGLDSFARHPFSHLGASLVTHEHAYGQLKAFLDEASALMDSVESFLESSSSLLSSDTGLTDAQVLTQAAEQMTSANLGSHLDLLEPGSTGSQALHAEQAALQTLTVQQHNAREATRHWRDKLAPQDTQAAQDLAQRLEASPLRWLQPSWWRLRGELQRRYDFSQHAIRPSYRSVLDNLAGEHRATAELQAEQQRLQGRYGVQDIDRFVQNLQALLQQLSASALLRQWLESLRGQPDALPGVTREASLRQPVARLSELLAQHCVFETAPSLGQLAEYLRDLREELDELPDTLPLLNELHQADSVCLLAVQQHALPQRALDALIAQENLTRLYRANPSLARFDGPALSLAAHQVSQAESSLLKHNAHVLSATLHQRFLQHVKQSAMSVTQLDAQAREFKKVYAKGRRELEHELGKTMRYRSIREMASGDSGRVINDLKPIWLMSPLSVSDTLPLTPDLFDVVIFDEASQIPSEEAVPALSRAQQVIVVGDEMQLPPTNFFSSAGDQDDNELIAMEDGEQIAINLDADSLLSQAARNLPATLLAWHYRSRHEALISFSNAAFYEGRLITIPDRRIERPAPAHAALESTDAQAVTLGADTLLDSPISFLKMSDGVYLSRSNLAEARYIAHLVRELLQRETGLSLGIVAFSEAQQGAIEQALEDLAASDSAFATRLEHEYVREDAGQFNGLFVKNLENVQGDERDVIILSICYAPGPNGKMLMNFGPINQRGGEKRLNVIFSRARKRMAIVSSIEAQAITNTHNDGAAALRAFLQFAQASASGDAPRSQGILANLNPGAKQSFAVSLPRDSLRAALAAALRKRGHTVQEYVGRSQFRCDLAISDANGEQFSLGVLLDGDTAAAANVRERYIFRPTVLRSFGWKIIDVLSHDWLRAPEDVLNRIEALLRGEEAPLLPEPEPPEPVEAQTVEVEAPPSTEALPLMREFTFGEGNSNKFWRIGVTDAEVMVNFGRIGTKGQTLIKSLDSPERASREAQKLIAEKLRKGYQEQAPSITSG